MTDRISTGMLRELSEYSVSHLVRELAAEVIELRQTVEDQAQALRQEKAEVIRLREALVRIEQHYTDTDLAAKHMAAIARAALNHKETDNGTA